MVHIVIYIELTFYLLYLQTSQNQDNAELFVNCLEAMVETCLPGDDLDFHSYPPSFGIASNLNLSSSMSSLSIGSMHSPTDRDCADISVSSNSNRVRHGSSSHVKHRLGSLKNIDTKKSNEALC